MEKKKKMYNMIPYKSKVMYAEDDIQNFSPIRHNINAYPRKENRCCDESSMVLLDDEHSGNTITAGNIYTRVNRKK